MIRGQIISLMQRVRAAVRVSCSNSICRRSAVGNGKSLTDPVEKEVDLQRQAKLEFIELWPAPAMLLKVV